MIAMPPSDAVLRDLGAGVLNVIAGTVTLGHTSPAYTLDYLHNDGTETLGTLLATDALAWTAQRGNDWRGSESRMRQYVRDSGYQRQALERMARRMGVG